MKKVTLIIGILVAVNVLMAQGPKDQRGPRGERGVKIEEFKERLELSDDQIEKLKIVKDDLKPELEALRKDDSMTRPDKMRVHADLVEKRENEVAKILSEDQLAELDVIKSELREKHRERKEGRRKGRHGDRNGN